MRAALTDRQALIATLYGEARGESAVSQAAVACVIANRVQADLHGDGKPDWWGEGWKDVCLKRWQFSCWWEDSLNTVATYEFAESLVAHRQWDFDGLFAIADLAMSEALKDTTHGATHYVTTALLAKAPPDWARGLTPSAVIGSHAFFAGVER
ncbi:MAG: hypothetical protein ABS36_11075 [Acidobacteria bacterium SCN 69-37]|nr:MAG: hypothetical protein ABS36_11075 [Acidobacteria bacterium SCN 69-37]